MSQGAGAVSVDVGGVVRGGGLSGCGDGLACELGGDGAPYEPGLGGVMVMRAVK
jgi:hypothetical protein